MKNILLTTALILASANASLAAATGSGSIIGTPPDVITLADFCIVYYKRTYCL